MSTQNNPPPMDRALALSMGEALYNHAQGAITAALNQPEETPKEAATSFGVDMELVDHRIVNVMVYVVVGPAAQAGMEATLASHFALKTTDHTIPNPKIPQARGSSEVN